MKILQLCLQHNPIIVLTSFYEAGEVGKNLIKTGKELENELSEDSNQHQLSFTGKPY